MSARVLEARIIDRAGLIDVSVASPLAESLASYLTLLATWNKKINLTALDVGTPTDDAIDRLIVEPLSAARQIRESDVCLIDIGSGGGSPALPLQLAAPELRVVLVESKSRKAAFLQEACRHLSLGSTRVENCRVDELPARYHSSASLVSVRAVRPDVGLLRTMKRLLTSNGRAFCFGGDAIDDHDLALAGLATLEMLPLLHGAASSLRILGRAAVLGK